MELHTAFRGIVVAVRQRMDPIEKTRWARLDSRSADVALMTTSAYGE